MKTLRWANLILAMLAVLAPAAHLLELANKLALDGPLWLAIQQHLYRGWGPLFGAPVEIGALATSLALLLARRTNSRTWPLAAIAVAAYAGMIAVFFALNSPVNAAVNTWTPATLPPDWAAYRTRWEAGHAVAALLAVVGLVALGRAFLHDLEDRRVR